MFAGRKHHADLKKIIEQWVEFRDLVQSHLGDEGVTQVLERRFLDLKGQIAERLARIGDGLPSHHVAEAAGTQKGMLEFMNAYPSLRDGGAPTVEQRDGFERQWQRYYLSLSQLKGLKVAGHKPTAHRAPIMGPPRHRHSRMDRFFGNWFVKLVVTVAVLVGALYALALILPWDRIGWRPDLAGVPGAAGSAVESGARFVERGAGGMGGFFGRITGFFSPVVAQYGPEATAIMCTVLLLAFGYWAFIRMR